MPLVGYSGSALPPDDEFDLTPFVDRLTDSPSWRNVWQDESPEMSAEEAARDHLDFAIQFTRLRPIEACDELCEAYEAEDAKFRRAA